MSSEGKRREERPQRRPRTKGPRLSRRPHPHASRGSSESEEGDGSSAIETLCLGLGNLDTTGGAEGRLDAAVETELTSGDRTNHLFDETSERGGSIRLKEGRATDTHDETGTHATEETLDTELRRELQRKR